MGEVFRDNVMKDRKFLEFKGKAAKITLVSAPGWLCRLSQEDVDRQKLTISSSGRVNYTTTEFMWDGCFETSSGRWQRLILPKSDVTALLDDIASPFRDGISPMVCHDAGKWELTITNDKGKKFCYSSALVTECFDRAEELSYRIRGEVCIPDFLAFDGGHGLSPAEYTYVSVVFSDGGKTYYYQTEDRTIKVGNKVVVPVRSSEQKVVTVVNIERFSEDELPMPADKVKTVIEKYSEASVQGSERVYDEKVLKKAHEGSIHNRRMIMKSDKCGCFYCMKIFSPEKIEEWVDDDDTAICPFCDIDSVIGDASGLPISTDFLKNMHRVYFESGIGRSFVTPFGEIKLTLDGNAQMLRYISMPKNGTLYPDVDGVFRVYFSYEPDGRPHELKIALTGFEESGDIESGERYEALSFYGQGGKLTVGCEADFGENEYDYDGTYENDGIVLFLSEKTKRQVFCFGVCWLNICTGKNDVQTWFGADPTV